jgi:hypothetical protein
MARYELGNMLRGYFSGEFETDEEAWAVLSERFNTAYPSRNGRSVELRKRIRVGQTEGGNEREEDRAWREALAATGRVSVLNPVTGTVTPMASEGD